MSTGEITMLVVAILLVPLAGLFAAMDAALQRVSKARVEEMRREGTRRAGALEQVVADRSRHVALSCQRSRRPRFRASRSATPTWCTPTTALAWSKLSVGCCRNWVSITCGW